jgi:hypothetical protein
MNEKYVIQQIEKKEIGEIEILDVVMNVYLKDVIQQIILKDLGKSVTQVIQLILDGELLDVLLYVNL